MSGNQSVPCPTCGSPLEVALQVQVEARLTKRPAGGYGLGAIRPTAGQIRQRLVRHHCDPDGRLELGPDPDEGEPEGEVVFCTRPGCDFMGTITDEGLEER